jgi:rSAM/selenodomain-associated transferase 1
MPAGRVPRLTAILSKRPQAGCVKTRLCPPLSPDQAARLAEAMLRDAVARCRATDAFATELCFAPAAEEAWFRATFPGLALRPQRGDGLAERLATLFAEVLDAGRAGTLVAIGGDQPLVEAGLIAAAHEALEGGADCVLAPDQGGGYCLVGLRRSVPELFRGVPMSSTGTLAATCELARARRLDVHLLEARDDVDVEADLVRLTRDLRARAEAGEDRSPDFPAATQRCLTELANEC